MNVRQPLEAQLIAALLAGDQATSRALAAQLHSQGFDADVIDAALLAHPELQEPLIELLQAVTPLSRRAARRRAIRAAEERDWGDWDEGRRELT